MWMKKARNIFRRWIVASFPAIVMAYGVYGSSPDLSLDPSREFIRSLEVSSSPFRMVSGTGASNPVRMDVANRNNVVPLPVADQIRTYLYLRVDFSDAVGDPIPGEQLFALVNGAANQWISDFSGGRQGIKGDILDAVLRMPETLSHYQTNDLTTELIEDALSVAAASGVPVGNYQYHVVCITREDLPDSEWIWAGLAGANSQIIREFDPHVLVHEIIHNFGPGHASRLQTSNGLIISDDAQVIEYGSPWDVMGAGRESYHSPNPILLNMAGWLDPDEVEVAMTDRRVRIHSFDSPWRGVTQALRIPASDGTYWVGFREQVPGELPLSQGSLLFMESGSSWSLLLDSTPGSPQLERDAPLDLGRSFENPDRNFWVTPVARGTEPDSQRQFMDLEVRFRPQGPLPDQPAGFIRGIPAVPARIPADFIFQSYQDAVEPGIVRWNLSGENRSRLGETIRKTWLASGRYEIRAEANGFFGNTHTNRLEVHVFDPLDQAEPVDILTTGTMMDAEYAGDLFVVVGERVRYSADGRNFTDVPSGGFFTDVDYAGGIFVACGQLFDFDQNLWAYGFIVSENGRDWTRIFAGDQRFTVSNQRFVQVEWCSNQWIAITANGGVWTSPDGYQWQSGGTMVPAFTIEQMVWSGDRLLAVTTTGVLANSTDGLQWQILRNDPKFTFTAISINAPESIIVAIGADNGLISTDGGNTFSEFQPLGAEGSGLLRGVGHIRASGTGFIGVHSDFISNQDFRYVASDNGREWELVGAPLAGRPRGFAMSEEGFLCVGDGGSAFFSPASLNEDSLFDAWISGFFEDPETDPENLLRTADPDLDDFDNYSEFLRGTNPADSSSVPSVHISNTPGGATLQLTTFLNPYLDGIEIELESSSDLKIWTDVETSEYTVEQRFVETASGQPAVETTISIPTPDSSPFFLKLAFELDQPGLPF